MGHRAKQKRERSRNMWADDIFLCLINGCVGVKRAISACEASASITICQFASRSITSAECSVCRLQWLEFLASAFEIDSARIERGSDVGDLDENDEMRLQNARQLSQKKQTPVT